jgi:NAD(P)H-hydrate epimerase
MIPTIAATDVPYLTTGQMIEVDRAMIEDYHIDLVRMMENAGRSLAQLVRERFGGGDPRGCRVIVLAGTGGNGGGALVAARRLHNYGATVEVLSTRSDEHFMPVPGHQLDIARRIGITVTADPVFESLDTADVVVDGIIGYSLSGAPRGAAAELIDWAEAQPSPIVSLDVPSGVDASTGTVHDPAISAAATLTLALPKEGLLAAGVDAHVGELYLADISVPPGLYAEHLGIDVDPIFSANDIVRLV